MVRTPHAEPRIPFRKIKSTRRRCAIGLHIFRCSIQHSVHMNHIARIVLFSILFCAGGCFHAQISVPADYGMTPSQIAHTWSRGYALPRNFRVHAQQLEANLYDVNLPQFSRHSAIQKSRTGCWAACVEMVTSYDGQTVDQNEAITRLHGKVADNGDDAGSVADIFNSLIGSGRSVYITNGVGNAFMQELLFDSPILISIRPQADREYGHVVVLAGMEFSFGPRGEAIVQQMKIFDPADGDEHDYGQDEIIRLRDQIGYAVQFRDYNRR